MLWGECKAACAAMLSLMILLCVGCGGEDWQAQTHPAFGMISINGQSPAGAIVELHATGEQSDVRNSRPWAVVREDGSYSLTTYQTDDGAPAGDYAVVVRWPPDVSRPSLADRLSGAYADPQKSRWKVTVAEGDNELPVIEITEARVQAKDKARVPRNAPAGPGMGF
jgi:hypothetical protein